MGQTFQALESSPELFIMVPPPLYKDGTYSMNQTVINEVFPKIIPSLGQNLGLDEDHIIDIFSAMGGTEMNQFELFCDGQNCDACHPNDSGYTFMASQIYKTLWKPTPSMATEFDFDLFKTP